MATVESVLRAVAPRANKAFIDASVVAAPAAMRASGITSPRAQAQLIAEMAHESAGFTRFEEGMNYSSKRLTQVWPSRFPTLAAAQPFANNPRALAYNVYNGRMGNRPGSNDGWNYRGSGGLQHTGASEFARVARRTGLDVLAHPEWLRDPAHADIMWRAAATYFADRGALEAARAGDTMAVRRKVNGGLIGLDDVKTLVARAERALGNASLTAPRPDAGPPVAPLPGPKTLPEDAEDKKKQAQNATVGAPAAGAGAGAAGAASGAEWAPALTAGLIVALALGAVAALLWRRAARRVKELEAREVASIVARAGEV
jgi:putative chitinase